MKNKLIGYTRARCGAAIALYEKPNSPFLWGGSEDPDCDCRVAYQWDECIVRVV